MVVHRSAQHAAEAAAAEESQRLRRAAAQEAMLKETFLEAVEAEKERLRLARDQALQHRPSSSSSALQVGSHASLTHHRAHWCLLMLSWSGNLMQQNFGACVSADAVQKHLYRSCTPIHFVLLYMVPRSPSCVVVAVCMCIERV